MDTKQNPETWSWTWLYPVDQIGLEQIFDIFTLDTFTMKALLKSETFAAKVSKLSPPKTLSLTVTLTTQDDP